MLSEEKALAQNKLTLKPATSTVVYNILQDLRHLIILDFRSPEEYTHSHIRNSQHATLESYKTQLMSSLSTKANKSHYESDDLKRALFVFPSEGWRNFESQISKVLP